MSVNLYISASNRKGNSYNFLTKIKKDDDILVSVADLNIKYCIGCNCCQKNDTNSCILKDDMNKLYSYIEKSDKIIIMSPIYMNHITGILKSILDRFNPYCANEKLKNKIIMLITVGQMSEEEQAEIVEKIDEYFKSISEFLYFDFKYLCNLTSGDVLDIDSIEKAYSKENLDKIVQDIKNEISL